MTVRRNTNKRSSSILLSYSLLMNPPTLMKVVTFSKQAVSSYLPDFSMIIVTLRIKRNLVNLSLNGTIFDYLQNALQCYVKTHFTGFLALRMVGALWHVPQTLFDVGLLDKCANLSQLAQDVSSQISTGFQPFVFESALLEQNFALWKIVCSLNCHHHHHHNHYHLVLSFPFRPRMGPRIDPGVSFHLSFVQQG